MNTIDAKKFYNEVMPGKQGSDYEYARWHKNAVATVGYEQTKSSLAAALPTLPASASILEIGPGAGTWTKLLVKHYPEATLTLLDISREMLDRSQAALVDRSITYVESALGDYKPSEQFDFIFSSRMLEYMENKELFATQISALLKPGGVALLTTKYPHYARQKLQGKKISTFHTGQIKPRELTSFLEKQGLKTIIVRPITVSVPLFKSAWLNKTFGKLVRVLPLTPATAPFVESYLVKVLKP